MNQGAHVASHGNNSQNKTLKGKVEVVGQPGGRGLKTRFQSIRGSEG